ncbi:hypothetical protein RFI_09403, partial [Reticulomyxa filosa]
CNHNNVMAMTPMFANPSPSHNTPFLWMDPMVSAASREQHPADKDRDRDRDRGRDRDRDRDRDRNYDHKKKDKEKDKEKGKEKHSAHHKKKKEPAKQISFRKWFEEEFKEHAMDNCLEILIENGINTLATFKMLHLHHLDHIPDIKIGLLFFFSLCLPCLYCNVLHIVGALLHRPQNCTVRQIAKIKRTAINILFRAVGFFDIFFL